ncbi:hypothetical protein ACIP6X_03815 [Streptomyces coeruleorubidus]|uniref:hypothetical protein n=1 Tax=Streptomyces coeruleorubidus TaxID=116188 RepID=UPI00381DD702
MGGASGDVPTQPCPAAETAGDGPGLDALCRLPVPAEAGRRGLALAAEHRVEWVRRNGVPEALPI